MRAATAPIVHLERITKRFGRAVAVEALDLAIAPGEFVTLLGPSGCGKSTTLRMIGGFETPDEGRIVLDGADVTRLPPNKRDVNMVFQDYALFPHMNVAKNIAFGLELKGMTRGDIDARLAELVGFLQLDALTDRLPDQLSGGQRQRVALARALAPDPKLLLLDEPLGALDAKLRSQLQIELKDIQKRTGKTFVFVTHDQDEALTMSDRVVVMNAGRIEQDGTPEDLYLHPKSRFVAEFIGETNLLSGPVRAVEESRVTLEWGGGTVTGTAYGAAPAPGATATGSLRLENIEAAAERPATDNTVEARIVNRIFKGSRTALHFEVGPAGEAFAAFLDPAAAAALPEAVWLGWSAANLSVLAD
ncbi:MAG: ABC transporter ATP-binding protein [Acuticoccus sp.]